MQVSGMIVPKKGCGISLLGNMHPGLTQFDEFWGAVRLKTHQTALVFHSQCVISNPVEEPHYRLGVAESKDDFF
jgi:hypothetical protein